MVFEGFWDFLSYLTIQKIEKSKHDIAVLNSVANVEKAMNFLKAHREIYTYLDNDDAGRKATELIQSANSTVYNRSTKYAVSRWSPFKTCKKMMRTKNKNGGRPKLSPAEKLKYRIAVNLCTKDYYALKAKAAQVGMTCTDGKQRQMVCQYRDNDLKYRYIKMRGQTDEESLYRMEHLFQYGDTIRIIRKQVELYEELVKEQAERIERAKRNSEEVERLYRQKENIKNAR
ncbi:hypothetical protein FACS1894207_0750 [Bacteroidia bacterium]|nr:hypothetical protein FACS1894207_0750 [Bacteroidia bacterium]